MDAIEADDEVRVVVFDSAVDGYYFGITRIAQPGSRT